MKELRVGSQDHIMLRKDVISFLILLRQHNHGETAVIQGVSMRNIDFSFLDLSNISFMACEIIDCKFTYCNMKKVKFVNCELKRNDFTGTKTKDMEMVSTMTKFVAKISLRDYCNDLIDQEDKTHGEIHMSLASMAASSSAAMGSEEDPDDHISSIRRSPMR